MIYLKMFCKQTKYFINTTCIFFYCLIVHLIIAEEAVYLYLLFLSGLTFLLSELEEWKGFVKIYNAMLLFYTF